MSRCDYHSHYTIAHIKGVRPNFVATRTRILSLSPAGITAIFKRALPRLGDLEFIADIQQNWYDTEIAPRLTAQERMVNQSSDSALTILWLDALVARMQVAYEQGSDRFVEPMASIDRQSEGTIGLIACATGDQGDLPAEAIDLQLFDALGLGRLAGFRRGHFERGCEE